MKSSELTDEFYKQQFLAVEDGNQEFIQHFLTLEGNDVNAYNEGGNTLLCEAAIQNQTEIVLLQLTHPEVDVNVTSDEGLGVMHLAAMYRNEVMQEAALRCERLDPNMRAHFGSTALHQAVRRRHMPCLKLMMSNPRVDKNAADSQSNTVLHNCVYTFDVFSMLLSMYDGFNLSKETHNGVSVWRHLIEYGDECLVELTLEYIAKQFKDHLFKNSIDT